MSKLVAHNIHRLSAYTPGASVEEIERDFGVRGAVKLASNENPLGASPAVVAAIQQAALDVHRYPDPRGLALRGALASQLGVGSDEIILGNGSNELIDMVCRVFASPADHVVFPDPSFLCYRIGCHAANLPFAEVELASDFSYSVDALLAAVTPKTRLLFLANPNNPTGTYVPGKELRRLLTALPRDVAPVLDEAYVEYVTAADFEDGLSLRELHPRLVVLRTFSKAYGLAGLRIGYAVMPPEMVGWMNRVRAPFNTNHIAQAAAIAALVDRAHLDRVVALNTKERDRLVGELGALGFDVVPSQANFILVGHRDLVDVPAQEVYERLIAAGVIVRAFGPPLDRHVRVSLGLPEENDRLVAAFESILTARPEPPTT